MCVVVVDIIVDIIVDINVVVVVVVVCLSIMGSDFRLYSQYRYSSSR
jgi:hypothetical protein